MAGMRKQTPRPTMETCDGGKAGPGSHWTCDGGKAGPVSRRTCAGGKAGPGSRRPAPPEPVPEPVHSWCSSQDPVGVTWVGQPPIRAPLLTTTGQENMLCRICVHRGEACPQGCHHYPHALRQHPRHMSCFFRPSSDVAPLNVRS